MRVLIQTRPRLNDTITGDVTQIFSTANALKKQGVEIHFSDSLEPDVDGIDVVHLFGTLDPRCTYLRLKYLEEQKVPVVVSTIYWEWEPEELKRESVLRLGLVGHYLSRGLSHIRSLSPLRIRYLLDKSPLPYCIQKRFYEVEEQFGLWYSRKFIFENADVLLPNSQREYHYLEQRFGIQNDYVVVPNAVDSIYAGGDAIAFYKKYGIKDFVLCVGAVEVRKNQIGLIRAMGNLDNPLVLVGTQERRYVNRCREEASKNTYFLGELRGDDLRNAYAAAKVHALVSFYETPGLSSLEAAVANDVVVVSDRGCTREYFQDQVFYCDPTSIKSIKNCVEEALRSKPNELLKERILRNYNWDQAAKMTIEGYEMAIKKKKK
jgi:glycosyltransferase involved in cell wall biosynthesis